MAGPIARVSLSAPASSEFTASGIDTEDADQVCAKVGDEDELSGGVEEGFMGVGHILAGIGAFLRESELLELQDFG